MQTPPLIPPDKLPEFQQFWEAYPRKRRAARPLAEKAFAKAIRKTTLSQMLASLEQHKQSEQWNKNGGQFTPLVTSWLNQERWRDTLTSIAVTATNGAGLTPIEKQIHNGEYLRILADMKAIRDSYAEHQTWSKKDIAEYRLLLNRRNQLRLMLGLLR